MSVDFYNTRNVLFTCVFILKYILTTFDSNFHKDPLLIFFCSENNFNVLNWFLNMQTILLLEVKFWLYLSATCKSQSNQR